jgi:hypothetical protein
MLATAACASSRPLTSCFHAFGQSGWEQVRTIVITLDAAVAAACGMSAYCHRAPCSQQLCAALVLHYARMACFGIYILICLCVMNLTRIVANVHMRNASDTPIHRECCQLHSSACRCAAWLWGGMLGDAVVHIDGRTY